MQYGKWEIRRELGKGGQGTVYLVQDNYVSYPILDSIIKAVQFLPGSHKVEEYLPVARGLAESLRLYLSAEEGKNLAALKVLHEHLRKDPKALARLEQEVHALTTNKDPHLIKILDSKLTEGWFVTAFMPLGTLADNLARFQGQPMAALRAFRPLVNTVAGLHRAKIIHRDIKPANIFFLEEGLVLGDLGLVFFADEAKTRISDTYENVGSRDWMPPWAYGKRVEELNPSFDVFSLGKVLWAMVSGKTLLPLWYHRQPEYDLTRLFPEDSHVYLINAVLDGCIRQFEEGVGYPTAVELLDQIDHLLAIMKRGGEMLRREIPRSCRVCGYGTYQLRVDDTITPGASHNVGITPVGHIQWRIFVCDRCGNVQMFQLQDRPEAWGE